MTYVLSMCAASVKCKSILDMTKLLRKGRSLKSRGLPSIRMGNEKRLGLYEKFWMIPPTWTISI